MSEAWARWLEAVEDPLVLALSVAVAAEAAAIVALFALLGFVIRWALRAKLPRGEG